MHIDSIKIISIKAYEDTNDNEVEWRSYDEVDDNTRAQ